MKQSSPIIYCLRLIHLFKKLNENVFEIICIIVCISILNKTV